MADNAPLWKLTRKSVTAELLKEIAAEYAKGRFLLIGTADLDARRAHHLGHGENRELRHAARRSTSSSAS